jgi:hypothetical protein
MTSEFSMIGLQLPAAPTVSVAVAAACAGGLGVLDLERAGSPAEMVDGIARLSRLVRQDRGSLGVRLPVDPSTSAILQVLPEGIGTCILRDADGGHPDLLEQQVDLLHAGSHRVLLEVTCLADAASGVQAGVDGLIGKGNEAGGAVGDLTAFVLLQQPPDAVPLPV